jgi:hypothetical protein
MSIQTAICEKISLSQKNDRCIICNFFNLKEILQRIEKMRPSNIGHCLSVLSKAK